MLKIAVCDDEPVFVEQISGRIKKYMPDAAIQGFFSSEELLSQGEVFDRCGSCGTILFFHKSPNKES